MIVCEDEKMVTDQTEVCNIFNKYFVNVAKDIGKFTPNTIRFLKPPNIEKIMENYPSN